MRVLFLVLVLALPGCAALKTASWLMPSSDGLSIDAELIAGDKQIDTQIGDRSEQRAQTINNVQDIPLLYILLFTLMAGWAIPSPEIMGRGIITFTRALLPWGRK